MKQKNKIRSDELAPLAKPVYSFKTMPSPVGLLRLIATDRGLAAVLWENDKPGRVPLSPLVENRNHPILVEAERELREYFGGQRTTFTVSLDPVGTRFQTAVWKALAGVPFGETRSYLDIARTIGNPAAVRAVGAANGKNPISIIVPCHRVIGASGKLTGFAGGLEVKQFLLDLEKAMGPSQPELGFSNAAPKNFLSAPFKWRARGLTKTKRGPGRV